MTIKEKQEYIASQRLLNNARLKSEVADDRTKSDIGWDNMQAGSYSALNSVLMGLPDFIIKNTSSDNYQALNDLRERSKGATLAGDIAGTVGSMFIPGGLIAKGAGLGTKALGAVRTGDKLMDAAKLIKTGGKIGSLGKIGSGVARGAMQGAEQGVARGLTGLDFTSSDSLAKSAMEGVKGATTSTALGGAMGGAISGLGKVANKYSSSVEKYSEELGDVGDRLILNKIGITDEAMEKAARLGMDDVAQGLRTGSTELLEKEFVNKNSPQLLKDGGDLARALNLKKSMDLKNIFKGKTGDEITKVITDALPDVSGDSLNRLKTLYTFSGAEVGKKLGTGTLTAVERLVNNPVLLTTLAGGGIGGVGALIGGDPEDIAKKAAMGAALGLVISKSPSRISKILKGGSNLGLDMIDALDTVPVTGWANLVKQGVIEAPKAAAILQLKAEQNTNPEATVDEKLNTMAPEKIQEATIEFSDQFKGVMDTKLEDIYQKYYSDLEPEDFMERIAEKTQNFQNMPAMSKLLFLGDDEGRDEFLNKYDTYLALKDLDFDAAISEVGGFDFLTGEKANKENAREILISNLVTLNVKTISGRPALYKKIEKDIAQIQDDPNLIGEFMETYGLNFKDLTELGLVN